MEFGEAVKAEMAEEIQKLNKGKEDLEERFETHYKIHVSLEKQVEYLENRIEKLENKEECEPIPMITADWPTIISDLAYLTTNHDKLHLSCYCGFVKQIVKILYGLDHRVPYTWKDPLVKFLHNLELIKDPERISQYVSQIISEVIENEEE